MTRTPEQKERQATAARKYRAKLTLEQKAALRAKYAARTPEQKATKKAKSAARRDATATPEWKAARRAEYAARSADQVEQDRARRATRSTPEWKAAKNTRDRARHATRTPEWKIARAIRDRTYKYGITPDQYDAMFTAQGGLCAWGACGRIGTETDHDHVSGAIRGLLCTQHNLALGLVGDDVASLRDGIAYLGRHEVAKEVAS